MQLGNTSLNWIDQLPHHFYRQEANVTAPFIPALKLAETVDLAIRTSISSILAGISIPAGFTGDKIAEDIEISEKPNTPQSDDSIFHEFKKHATIHREKVRQPLTVRKGIFEKLWWQTAYRSEESYEQHTNNKLAVAYHLRHGDKPRPTIILVHGFIAANWSINEFFLGMNYLYDLGCDIVLKTLPHHGERQGPSSYFSGIDYVSGGIQNLNHAVVQSTYDIRALVDYLTEDCQVEKVGLSGLSLGGYTSALMAGLEDRFEFVMPIIPIISIPDAMMEWKPLDKTLNNIMDNFSLNMPKLRQTMAFHSPLTREAKLKPERLMIIAGLGDKMATPRHAEALQKHWNGCHLHWFKGSHALPLDRNNTNIAKGNFLRSINFV